ncbi:MULTISPECIES: hypothetical protein [unclassified Lysobacter]|uniref:hypothetical protein n=1 Tax=unclassified Lysobacter TaxID=2635362 RepID=UPI001BE78700|nr:MULTISPECIES: hypothetical protein [unclassified Lysobacter]MBT2746442.1 hypothetical protein [Lysobacter sp. ISL-42]MBT2753201.1 hypothetical protein [Lysobacter sp. ISL-50]MBT2776624.1 hypothetical protein [Lysobacter sp. ISL-54]MBT2783341.1 hypothetical protein [Lysobacter sp. ISL-52]
MDRNAMLCAVVLMLASLWPWRPARADLFEPPHVKTYLSGNGRYRLTVTPSADPAPRERKDVPPEKAAQARMERREGAGWVQVWRGPLRNPVAPPWLVVSDDGRTATFNDWYGAGHGPRVVVLYDTAGRMVRSLGLEQLLPADYVRALPRSVSSIGWGREHRFSADGRQVLLRVAIPNNNDRSYEPAGYVELALDATTGRRASGYETALRRAYVQAAPAIAREQVLWEATKAVRRAPLLAPATGDYGDWNHYLSEACRRLDPDAGEREPGLRRIQMQAGRADLPELRQIVETLSNPDRETGALVFATAFDPRSEQDALVAALAKAAQEAPAGRLAGRRVCVLVDDQRSAAAAAALARTGATYVQLDPSRPIAQRPEVLRELERN